MVRQKSFHGFLPLRRLKRPYHLQRLFRQPVSVIWTVRCFSIVLYKRSVAKMMQRLLTECLPAVFMQRIFICKVSWPVLTPDNIINFLRIRDHSDFLMPQYMHTICR